MHVAGGGAPRGNRNAAICSAAAPSSDKRTCGLEYPIMMGYLDRWSPCCGRRVCASSSSSMTIHPAHVHVFGDGEAKINLSGPDGAPELVWADNMSRGEVRPSMRLVAGELHARTD